MINLGNISRGKKSIEVTKTCPFSKKNGKIIVALEDYNRWQKGEKIHRVFIHATPDQREFIMTGILPEGWAMAYPTEDDG